MAILIPNPFKITTLDSSGNALATYTYKNNLDYWFTDHNVKKQVHAKIAHTDVRLNVFSGTAYDAAGNYTQSDLDNIISGFITGDQLNFVSGLFTNVAVSGSYIS